MSVAERLRASQVAGVARDIPVLNGPSASLEVQPLIDELVNGSADAAFVIDAGQRIVGWNDRATALTGFSASEALGQRCYRVLAGVITDGRPLCTPECAPFACFLLKQPFSLESATLVDRGGERIAISLSTVVLGDLWRQMGVLALVLLRPAGLLSIEVPSPLLRVYALGAFRVFRGAHELGPNAWTRKQALALFKILLAQRGHPVHRESLLETLWPDVDPDQGLRRLKVVVHSLRRTLESGADPSAGSRFIVREEETYLIPADAVWVDASRFEGLVRYGTDRAHHSDAVSALQAFEEAERLYGGDYMEEDRYAEWCAAEREMLRELFLSAEEQAAALYAGRGEYSMAVEKARRALKVDAYREATHRALMRYLGQDGRVDEAVRQYHECVATLERELGASPTRETVELYRRLVASRP